MQYQNNEHWHGVAAVAAVAPVAALAAVEEDSSATVVALAVEEDSLGMDSINISYKQPAKSILVTVTWKMQTQVPIV
jgi:hypothetical protein